jgi:hypothetical protein
MRIEKLELFGFTRLTLKNIRHFVYTPQSPYQLILGTNGSGKSSVLSELSPLPAHKDNFEKDGYKRITISHRGKTYQLNSDFKTGKHSFDVDGQVLNPGGTAEVQKTLVQQHFSYTKEIHELATGEIRFTEMSPNERRHWIMMFSKTDYTFAMNAFKRLASMLRDQTGAAKHLRARLLSETNTLASLQEEHGLEERAAKLREEMNQLMLERIPNMPSLTQQQQRLSQLYDQVQQWCKDYWRNLTYVPSDKKYSSLDDVRMDIQRIETGIQTSQAVLDRMGSEYNEVEALINSVQVDAGESLEELPNLIADAQRAIGELQDRQFTFPHLLDPEQVQRDWLTIRTEVIPVFRSLPDNTDRKFTRETMQQARDKIAHYQGHVDVGTNKIEAMRRRQEIMSEAKETKCPSCNYIWREGYSELEYGDLSRWITEHAEKVSEAREQIKQAQLFLEECEVHNANYQRFRGFVGGYPRLQPLWDFILSNSLLFNNPAQQLGVFVTWENDLDTHVKLEAARRRLSRYEEVQQRHNAMGDAARFAKRMRTLQDEIQLMTAHVLRQRDEHRRITRFMSRMTQIHGIVADLERTQLEIGRIEGQLVDALRNQVIDETVDTHQSEMVAINRKISEKEGQAGLVRDIQNDLKNVELETSALQLVVQTFSPKEGLIAEQLAGDIGCLVAQLNSIIASVWTYEMKVLSCGIEQAELDYRFPVEFSLAAGWRSKDVSKTSKGQKQMFDIAFHLTVMMYLGLENYPLFLDEPGEGFDEQHRINLMSFVKQLMDMNQFSQLFMVSHYASSHGSFTNAEVLVLDETNIAVPGNYNQHVVLN